MPQRNTNLFGDLRAQVGSFISDAHYLSLLRKWPLRFRLLSYLSRRYEKRFIFLTFSMLGKLALSDGRVDEWEHHTLERFMHEELQLTADQKIEAYRILRGARALRHSMEELARQYYLENRRNRRMLEHLIGVFLDLCNANADFSELQQKLVSKVINIFGISKDEYLAIKRRHDALLAFRIARGEAAAAKERQEEERKAENKQSYRAARPDPVPDPMVAAYAVLGLQGSEDMATVKKAYRALALKHHPDRLRANGLPPEFLKRASDAFREIQAAYDAITATGAN